MEVGTGELVDRYEVTVVAAAGGWSGKLVRVVVHVDEGDDPANPFAPSRKERRETVAKWPSDATCATASQYSDLFVPVAAAGDVFGVPLADLARSKSFETSLKWVDYGSGAPAPTTVTLDVAPRGGSVCLSPSCGLSDACDGTPTSDLPPTDHVFVGTPVTIRARTESGDWNSNLDTMLWSEVSRRGEQVGHWVSDYDEYDDSESLRAAKGIEVDPDGATLLTFSLDLEWPAREGGTPAPWGSFVVWGAKSDADTCTEPCSGLAWKKLAGAGIGIWPPERR